MKENAVPNRRQAHKKRIGVKAAPAGRFLEMIRGFIPENRITGKEWQSRHRGIGILMWLNIRGMREASLLNEVIGVLIIFTECAIIIMGFMLVWHPQLVTQQWVAAWAHFEPKRFLYGSSLAIISFVGLESISQAAQETRRPATIVSRRPPLPLRRLRW